MTKEEIRSAAHQFVDRMTGGSSLMELRKHIDNDAYDDVILVSKRISQTTANASENKIALIHLMKDAIVDTFNVSQNDGSIIGNEEDAKIFMDAIIDPPAANDKLKNAIEDFTNIDAYSESKNVILEEILSEDQIGIHEETSYRFVIAVKEKDLWKVGDNCYATEEAIDNMINEFNDKSRRIGDTYLEDYPDTVNMYKASFEYSEFIKEENKIVTSLKFIDTEESKLLQSMLESSSKSLPDIVKTISVGHEIKENKFEFEKLIKLTAKIDDIVKS